MRKHLAILTLALAALVSAPHARAQAYTDAFLSSVNYNTTYPCGNGTGTPTGDIQQALQAAAYFGGGTVDLTCYQSAVTITSDVFSGISAPILLYLPEHAVTVSVAATIPSNFEICGGPGSSISGGSLTNNATACFNGFTGGGGGTPGGADGTIQFNNAGTFDGVLNSSVDPDFGDVTLGSALLVVTDVSVFDAPRAFGGPAGIWKGDDAGIDIDSTGGMPFGSTGTGPINFTSAGGIVAADTSSNGLFFTESGTGGFTFDATGNGSQTGPGTGSVQFLSNGGIFFAEGSAAGIGLDATSNGGTGPINFTSAGGVVWNSSGGSHITETGSNIELYVSGASSGPIQLENDGVGGIQIDATGGFESGTGTGPINFRTALSGAFFIGDGAGGAAIESGGSSGVFISSIGPDFGNAGTGEILESSAGTVTFDDSALSGGGSKLDLDATTPGVITATTIFNAVGGYQANGVAGISEVCTVIPTGITISFGIITAITGGTCTP